MSRTEGSQDPHTNGSSAKSDSSPWTDASAKFATVSRFTSLFRSKQKKIMFPPLEWAEPLLRHSIESPAPSLVVPSSSEPGFSPVQSSSSFPSSANTKVYQDGSHIPESREELLQEATTLAKRIRTLLSSLPPTKSSDVENVGETSPLHITIPPADSSHPVNLTDGDDLPLPPAVGSDSKLLKWLSNESVMNGSLAKGGQSVWAALEKLGRPTKSTSTANENNTNKPLPPTPQDPDQSDNESLMLYAPLEPDVASTAEIAESVAGDEDREPQGATSQTEHSSHTIWLPHPTQISIEALWWGYCLYLPPAVLDRLDSNRIKAAQRAAMITSVLKWLMDQIPNLMIPPQYRPAIQVIKSLSPYLSYVGVVVTWSWGKIMSMNQGNGVILMATWLLPIALIPCTWKLGEPPTLVVVVTTEDATVPEETPVSETQAAAVPEVPEEPGPSQPVPQLSKLKSMGKYFSRREGKSDPKELGGKGKQRATK